MRSVATLPQYRDAVAERTRVSEDEERLFRDLLRTLDEAFKLRQGEARDRAEELLATYRAEARALARDIALKERYIRETGQSVRWQWGSAAPEDLAAEIAHRRNLIAFLTSRAAAVQAMLHRYRKANLVNDEGPTPETIAKPARQDPILYLVETNRIDNGHERCANEIAMIWQAVTAQMFARNINLMGAGGAGDHGVNERIALLHAFRYLPWTDRMHRDPTQNLELVIDVAVDRISLYAASRRHRLAHQTTIKTLRRGLSVYQRVRTETAWLNQTTNESGGGPNDVGGKTAGPAANTHRSGSA